MKILNNLYIFIIIIVLVSCSNSRMIQNYHNNNLILNEQQTKLIDLGDGWFQVTESIFIQNITPEKAREKAIEKACIRAIEFYSGVEITVRDLGIQAENNNKVLLDNFSSITQQITHGIITEKEILKEEIISKENNLVKVVTVKVKIENQKGKKDPAFQITANLNRDYYRDGEEIELFVKSSKDCYLTVLNICSNDSVYVIFPNKYRKDNFLKAGDTFHLPNSKDNEIGLYFPVKLLPNKNEDVEMIKIIAAKKKINFSSLYSFSAYGTYQTALKDLQNWLIQIPRNEVEEFDLQYFIVE